ncbi:horcolin-like [Cynara cardunculus var. scolymus]|uniref:Mannose-binding lectin n=1 Tax=Cynara cardunculus var. scolymus TaxID=59895 RepID=A0A118JRY0_CYNCS|nr:horcolin-like [Cynara cardunculus var. scolymus]KVH87807.1 Mannose-binding lectin [Cynara cardunculus var. scolymus]
MATGEVGPWGGHCAGPWTFKPDGRIIEIWIASGNYIDSIRFVYEDQHLVKHHSPKYGGDGGTEQKIAFDEDEELNQMSGTTGDFVASLSFRTNKRSLGPYGRTDEGTSFSLPVAKGKFVGFFGECGYYLDSIGAILQF